MIGDRRSRKSWISWECHEPDGFIGRGKGNGAVRKLRSKPLVLGNRHHSVCSQGSREEAVDKSPLGWDRSSRNPFRRQDEILIFQPVCSGLSLGVKDAKRVDPLVFITPSAGAKPSVDVLTNMGGHHKVAASTCQSHGPFHHLQGVPTVNISD
uniref:Uncharacterized protein n=1 Tax=Coccidioides posadasii RMSCC 3488 TaxID=454284 RepID=A0A0J6I4K8_COCPO|nr:hypothetical protein CPAG_02646 [Coccidioides posadasii RMSCC 3488]